MFTVEWIIFWVSSAYFPSFRYFYNFLSWIKKQHESAIKYLLTIMWFLHYNLGINILKISDKFIHISTLKIILEVAKQQWPAIWSVNNFCSEITMEILLCPYQICIYRFCSLPQQVLPSSTEHSKESPVQLWLFFSSLLN